MVMVLSPALPARTRVFRRLLAVLVGSVALAVLPAAAASAQLPTTDDPRVGLAPGLENPETAALGMQHLANRPKPAGFVPPDGNPGNFGFLTSDMAFQGDHAFVGSFNGFQIWNVDNPAAPALTTAVVCPGGQGDLSVYRNLLFMSVEETRAKIDCSSTPPADATTRFRGVRIFDISNIAAPVQVAAVQTCRGSHTHTLVTDKHDRRNVYIYVQGTAGVRPATELAGCDGNNTNTPTGDNPTKWRIEVIKVPVNAPQNAAIVSEPRLFANDAGAVNGLQNEVPTPLHPCASAPQPCGPGTGATGGANWSPTPITDACHDITVYPEIGLAAGACEGNGLLIDIRDPANPKRLDAVADPNYAYWHGATFSNDGKTVIFTDEWGGGVQPRCRPNDDLDWGGDSIYEIVKGKLVFRSYYKIPMVQTLQENCVSHIPSLIPVPGRDIFVQAFYQGGASLVDFSDPSNPVEIGYFDRGPVSTTETLIFGGFWSTYWYNGEWYGSELARNFDVVGLTPTANLSENEIAAAREVQVRRLNVQRQDKFRWDPSFAVVRSFRDQLVRAGDLGGRTLRKVDDAIDKAEHFADRGKFKSAAEQLEKAERELKGPRKYEDLRDALDDLADSFDRKHDRHHKGKGRWR
jgi:LVIVD repeat